MSEKEKREMFTYTEIKKALYSFEGALGVLFLWLAYRTATISTEHALLDLPLALILATVGCTCFMFAIEAFFLRDDPDIWR